MEQMNGRGIIEEVLARVIYDSWIGQPGWAPWAAGGNSDKQEEARRLARAALSDPAISYATALCQQGEPAEALTPDELYEVVTSMEALGHDERDFEAECPACTAVRKLKARLAALSTSEGKTE